MKKCALRIHYESTRKITKDLDLNDRILGREDLVFFEFITVELSEEEIMFLCMKYTSPSLQIIIGLNTKYGIADSWRRCVQDMPISGENPLIAI